MTVLLHYDVMNVPSGEVGSGTVMTRKLLGGEEVYQERKRPAIQESERKRAVQDYAGKIQN